MRTQNKELKTDIQNLNQEQDNLLVLLQEMEEKLKKYKKLLKTYNCSQISEDEEDAEDAEDESENGQINNNKQDNNMINKPIDINHQQSQQPILLVNSISNDHSKLQNNNFLYSSSNNYESNNLNDPNKLGIDSNVLIYGNSSLNSSADSSSDVVGLKPSLNNNYNSHFNGLSSDTSTTSTSGSSNNSIDHNYNMSMPPPVGQNFNTLDLTNNLAQINFFHTQTTSNNNNQPTNNLQSYFGN